MSLCPDIADHAEPEPGLEPEPEEKKARNRWDLQFKDGRETKEDDSDL